MDFRNARGTLRFFSLRFRVSSNYSLLRPQIVFHGTPTIFLLSYD